MAASDSFRSTSKVVRQTARIMIREYEPARHHHQLRACVIELQDFERNLEPALPEGQQIADAYLTFLLDRCAISSGKVFVLEVDNVVVGFVGVLTRVLPEEPDEDQAEFAYISDLVVLPSYRRQGLGRTLLQHAEAFARDRGAKVLRVGVLIRNRVARELYRKMGFTDYQVQLVKRL